MQTRQYMIDNGAARPEALPVAIDFGARLGVPVLRLDETARAAAARAIAEDDEARARDLRRYRQHVERRLFRQDPELINLLTRRYGHVYG